MEEAGVHRDILASVKRRKLSYFGHVIRKSSCIDKDIMEGTMPGERRRGCPRLSLIDNVKALTGLTLEEALRKVDDRGDAANPRVDDG